MKKPPQSHKLTTVQKFGRKVLITDSCWEWLGSKRNKGYGAFQVTPNHCRNAHRFAYEILKGPIPDGLTIDHLCRNTGCVNPEHLEAVTNRENTLRGGNPCAINARKTHCKHGHEFTPENTFEHYRGGRGCITCNRKYQRDWARRKAARKRACMRVA